MPTCWLIAGPNGAGKTTFAMHYLPQVARCHNFINADLIAAGLSPLAPQVQQVAAARLLLQEIETNFRRRSDFAVETTLAGRGYLRLVDRLRADGWRVEMIYLALPDRAASHRRVAERVAQGGHDIPVADIERRFGRSLRHLLEDFSKRVDFCQCFMNSGRVPELVFEQTGEDRTLMHNGYYQALLAQSQT
jgi:predicted ABC-type ATPase